jgi:hypothetical protein
MAVSLFLQKFISPMLTESGTTEAGTTQRDVVRAGVVNIGVSVSVTQKWLKMLTVSFTLKEF